MQESRNHSHYVYIEVYFHMSGCTCQFSWSPLFFAKNMFISFRYQMNWESTLPGVLSQLSLPPVAVFMTRASSMSCTKSTAMTPHTLKTSCVLCLDLSHFFLWISNVWFYKTQRTGLPSWQQIWTTETKFGSIPPKQQIRKNSGILCLENIIFWPICSKLVWTKERWWTCAT